MVADSLVIADDVGMLFGDVVLFAGIFRQIEQLGLAREQGALHKFPVALADGPAESFDVDQDVLVRDGLPTARVGQISLPSNGWLGCPCRWRGSVA